MVPMEMLTSMLLEPSSGSKHTMYLPGAVEDARLLELLAGDHRAAAAPLEHGAEHVVGERVELLDLLALHVGLAGVAEHPGEAGRADAGVDDADRRA